MSALLKHISQQQDAACTLKGVLEAITFLDNKGSQPNALTALISVALAGADALYVNLDCVNLPEVGA